MKWFSIGLLLFASSTEPAIASMQSYVTQTGATVGGKIVSARVDFTTNNNGTISVTLTNLLTNNQLAPSGWFDVQLVGGVKFKVSGAIGSTVSTTGNGAVADIVASNGTYTPVLNDPLTRWKSTAAGSVVDLSMFSGGQPNRQIIGTDSLGTTNGSGVYWPVAGNVADNFAPVVLGSANFTLTVSGVTAATTISDVQFRFSTNQSTFVAGQVNEGGGQGGPVVPEPTSLALAGFAGIGFALRALRRRQSQKSDQAA